MLGYVPPTHTGTLQLNLPLLQLPISVNTLARVRGQVGEAWSGQMSRASPLPGSLTGPAISVPRLWVVTHPGCSPWLASALGPQKGVRLEDSSPSQALVKGALWHSNTSGVGTFLGRGPASSPELGHGLRPGAGVGALNGPLCLHTRGLCGGAHSPTLHPQAPPTQHPGAEPHHWLLFRADTVSPHSVGSTLVPGPVPQVPYYFEL